MLLGKQPDVPWPSCLGAQKSSPVFPPTVGQDRSHKEQLAPGVRQGFFPGLLLRGGAEAQIRSLRHPRHSQHRNP